MTRHFNLTADGEATPIQQQGAEAAEQSNLEPQQAGVFSKLSDMVSEGVLSLSKVFNDNSPVYGEDSASIKREFEQYQTLQKEAELAKNHSVPQDGLNALTKKVEQKEYTINPTQIAKEVEALAVHSEDNIKALQRQLNLPETGKADNSTASNFIIHKGFLGAEKGDSLLASILDGTLEGLKTNPVPNSKVMQSSLMHFGEKAVEAIEKREGALSLTERRVAEEEGFFNGYYLDSKKVLTFGVGQTREFMDKTFKESVAAKTNVLKAKITSFDSIPEPLQAELVQSAYRGGLTGSPTALKLINKRQYQAAAKAFLDNAEYRQAKRDDSGIAPRMEKTARAIRLLSSI